MPFEAFVLLYVLPWSPIYAELASRLPGAKRKAEQQLVSAYSAQQPAVQSVQVPDSRDVAGCEPHYSARRKSPPKWNLRRGSSQQKFDAISLY